MYLHSIVSVEHFYGFNFKILSGLLQSWKKKMAFLENTTLKLERKVQMNWNAYFGLCKEIFKKLIMIFNKIDKLLIWLNGF